MIPCDDALAALPGDLITFQNEFGQAQTSRVKTCFWQSAPKGGKVWSYELHDGTVVPNDSVSKVQKSKTETEPKIFRRPIDDIDHLTLAMCMIEESNLPSISKTIIQCVVDGDLSGLKIAAHLCETRLRQLKSIDDEIAEIQQSESDYCLAIPKE